MNMYKQIARNKRDSWFLMTMVVLILLGLGFAIGFFTAIQGHNPEMLGLVFTLAFGFIFCSVLFLPFLHAAAEQGFDARRCLIFPVPLSQLYAILMLSELGGAHYVFAYPTLLAVLAAGIWVAHGAFLPAMGVVLLFAVMTAVWSNLLMLGLQRLLQKRRLREAVILATAFILLSIGILPQVVIQRTQRIKAPGSISSAGGFLKAASGALPPVWASNAMMALQAGNWKGVPAQAIWKRVGEAQSILRVIVNALNVTLPAPEPGLWLPMFRVCAMSKV